QFTAFASVVFVEHAVEQVRYAARIGRPIRQSHYVEYACGLADVECRKAGGGADPSARAEGISPCADAGCARRAIDRTQRPRIATGVDGPDRAIVGRNRSTGSGSVSPRRRNADSATA